MNENPMLGTQSDPVIIPDSDEKTIALLSHLLTFIAPILGPLIIYLIKKGESAFVEHHAKESLNFQITMVIISIILVLTIIGILLLWIVGILAVVLVIVAAVRASEGKLYKYPFSLRLVK